MYNYHDQLIYIMVDIDICVFPSWTEYNYRQDHCTRIDETNHYQKRSNRELLQWITLLGWKISQGS
jgi:hypothetical protein